MAVKLPRDLPTGLGHAESGSFFEQVLSVASCYAVAAVEGLAAAGGEGSLGLGGLRSGPGR